MAKEQKWKKTAKGMEYKELPPRTQVFNGGESFSFPEGGVLYYRGNMYGKFIYPVAYAKMVEGWWFDDYEKEFESVVQREPGIRYQVKVVDPLEEACLNFQEPISEDWGEFLEETFATIKSNGEKMMEFFHLEEDEVAHYYRNVPEQGKIRYFGVSTLDFYQTQGKELDLENIVIAPISTLKRSVESGLRSKDLIREMHEASQSRQARQQGDKYEKREALRHVTVKGQIEDWLERTPFTAFLAELEAHVKGQEQLEFIAGSIYNFLTCVVRGVQHSSNFILAAPSGCGKTETYRTILHYFAKEIPLFVVSQVDMTSITEEGYKGRNTINILDDFMRTTTPAEVGIVFMDEFDKKLLPSYSSLGSNVNAAVQNQILTLIEGRIASSDKAPQKQIDTRNILFVGLGAFDMVREKHEKAPRELGFGAGETERKSHYSFITREDMIEVGASYELLGRFTTIINYHALSEEAQNEIIDLIRARNEEKFGFKIVIGEGMMKELHENANSKYGCRILNSLIYDCAMQGYMSILRMDGNCDDYTVTLVSMHEALVEKNQDEPDTF